MSLENYLSNINKENPNSKDLLDFLDNLDIELNEGDKELLIGIHLKIKADQLLTLKSRHLDPLFQQIHLCLADKPVMLSKLIDIVTYNYPESIPEEKIKDSRDIEISEEHKIYVDPWDADDIRKNLHDKLLEEQLKELGGEEFFQTYYRPLYNLRHRFMLNKSFSDGLFDFPSAISERLLTVYHGRSMYLSDDTTILSHDEKELLAKIYPQDKFTRIDLERHNKNIELSENQISGAVKAYFNWLKEEGPNVFLDKQNETSSSDNQHSDPLFGTVSQELKDDRKEKIARLQKQQQLIKLAEDGDTEKVLRFFSKNDIDPDKLLLNGKTVLMIASEHGRTALVEALIKKLEVDIHVKQDSADSNNITAIRVALSKNHLDVINILLENGATLSTEELIKLFPVAAAKKDLKLVGSLLKSEDIRNAYYPKLSKILVKAYAAGDVSTVKLLLSAGQNPNPAIGDSLYLIHHAAEFSSPAIFQLLTQYVSADEFGKGPAYPSKFAGYNKHKDNKNIIALALCKEAEYEHSKGYNYTARRLLKKAKQLKAQSARGDKKEGASNQELLGIPRSKYLMQTTWEVLSRILDPKKRDKIFNRKSEPDEHQTAYLKLGLFLGWLCFLSSMVLGFFAEPSLFFLAAALICAYPQAWLIGLLFQTSIENLLEFFDPTSEFSNNWINVIKVLAHALNICLIAYAASVSGTALVLLEEPSVLVALTLPWMGYGMISAVIIILVMASSIALALVVATQFAVTWSAGVVGKSLSNFIYTKMYGPDDALDHEIKALQAQFIATPGSTLPMLKAMPPGEAEFTEESLESLLGNYGHIIEPDRRLVPNDQLDAFEAAEMEEFVLQW